MNHLLEEDRVCFVDLPEIDDFSVGACLLHGQSDDREGLSNFDLLDGATFLNERSAEGSTSQCCANEKPVAAFHGFLKAKGRVQSRFTSVERFDVQLTKVAVVRVLNRIIVNVMN